MQLIPAGDDKQCPDLTSPTPPPPLNSPTSTNSLSASNKNLVSSVRALANTHVDVSDH